MFSKVENIKIKKIFPFLIILVFLVLIFYSAPKDWINFFFLDHDYPFDFYSWKSLYINQSSGRISTLALVGLLPNVVVSQLLGTTIPFFQSFVIKIIPLIFFLYVFGRNLIDWSYDHINRWQDYLFVLLAILLIFFGLTGQMFFNSGIFYSFIFQLNFYLFLLHLCAYLHSPNLIYQERYIYLAAAIIQTSIIVGSTFIPTSLYFCILFFGGYKKLLNIKNLILLALLILSALIIYYLSRYQNISLNSGVDELNASVINRGYENISGGYFYQLIGFSNWGIYTGWPDRLIGGFSGYFNKPQYQFALLLLNIASLYWMYKNGFNKLCILILIFLIFSVGSQPPFGSIFIWIVDHIPGFESIRTPDNKFGFYTQAILILSLIRSWGWYSKKIKKILFISLFLVSVFNLYPLFSGKVLFGYNSQFSPNSSFVLDIRYEKHLLSSLNKDDFILIVPGYGVIDHPSGRIGLIDPIYSIHEKVISYSTAISDPNSNYYDSLKFNNLASLKDINAIIVRKSYQKVLDEMKLNLAGFKNIYEDQFVIIYKSNHEPGKLLSNNYWLWQIIISCLILYTALIYFIYKYSFSSRMVKDV
jgi:hypothetical protein